MIELILFINFKNNHVDIICLQEVFDESSWEILNDTLKPFYPYILYDPFKMFLRWNHFCVINSGLYIASKYPIIRSEFFTFSDAYFEDAACSRGLLIAEIDIQNNRSIIVGKCKKIHWWLRQKFFRNHSSSGSWKRSIISRKSFSAFKIIQNSSK